MSQLGLVEPSRVFAASGSVWHARVSDSPEELLPLQLVELGDDVVEGALDLGDDDVLDGVDAPVRRLDHLVQCHEGRLQRRQLHQQLHGAGVVLLQDLRAVGKRDYVRTAKRKK